MVTNIWLNGRYTEIDPEEPVHTSKAITSFAAHNNLRNCLVRSQGGWYKIHLNGIMTFETRTLYLISFADLYNILKD